MPTKLKPLEWLKPEVEQTDTSNQHVWRTRCGRYAVRRCISRLRGGLGNRFVACFERTVTRTDGSAYTMEDFIGKDDVSRKSMDYYGRKPCEYRVLSTAIAALEELHYNTTGGDQMSNKEETITAAEKEGLDRLPARDEQPETTMSREVDESDQPVGTQPERESPMSKTDALNTLNVPRERITGIMAKLKYAVQNKKKWPDARIKKTLASWPKMFGQDDQISKERRNLLNKLTDAEREYVNDIVVAAAEGAALNLVGDETPSENGHKPSRKHKVPNKAKTKKSPADKKEKSKRDNGLVEYVIDSLKKHSKESPLDREKLYEAVAKKFDKDLKKVKNYVGYMLSHWLKDRHGIHVKGNAKTGFWA